MSKPQPMTAVEVGKPYSQTRTRWDEGVDYNYRSEQHELRLFLDDPSPREIKDITKNPSRFAVAVSGDVIFFCYKFGDMPWGDAPYSIHLVPEDQRILPPVTGPNERALLTVILIDAITGIVKGLRAVSFSPTLTQYLHEAIRKQAVRPFPPRDDYDFAITRIYNAYDSAGIANVLAAVRCQGGQ